MLGATRRIFDGTASFEMYLYPMFPANVLKPLTKSFYATSIYMLLHLLLDVLLLLVFLELLLYLYLFLMFSLLRAQLG